MPTPSVNVLTVPGLGDAGPDMWLSLWEREEGWTRVVQADWDDPDPEAWAEALRATVAEAEPPVLLVAHSLGCLTVARAGPLPGVAGALLVAPPDAEQPLTKPEIARWGPGPWEALRFPSVVVASQSDPWCEHGRAAALARAWGARLVDAGAAGHIATADGFGPWPAGRAVLEEVREAASSPLSPLDPMG